jgi:type I restriction enzyme S subunit
MTLPVTPIGKLVTKVETWDPKTGADGVFKYIDLSSVDKDTKCIAPEMVLELATQEAPSRARQIVRAGDVLVATVRPNLNGVTLVDKEFDGATASTGYCVLRPQANQLDSSYLFHWVKTPAFVSEMVRQATGASYPAVSDGIVKGSLIPLPSLHEQERIAAILDKADAIRRKRQQAIQMAGQFLRAVFLDMFGDPVVNPKGWKESTFGEVFDVRDGTHESPAYVATGYPLVTSKNIKNGEIDLQDVRYISSEDYEMINKRSQVDVGDVLMPMIGTIGNPVQIKREPKFAIKNVALIKPSGSHLPAEFIVALLNSSLLGQAIAEKSRGGTQKFLSLGDIRALRCFLPPKDLVTRYKEISQKIEGLVRKQRGLQAKSLFESLSQKAFAGEL